MQAQHDIKSFRSHPRIIHEMQEYGYVKHDNKV